MSKFGMLPGRSGLELRLRSTKRRHELRGPILYDPEADADWWALDFYSRPQRAHVMVASLLYRAVGVLVPDMVTLDAGDGPVIAFPAMSNWIPMAPKAARAKYNAELQRIAPAREWLRDTASMQALRFRRNPIPRFPPVLVADLSQCMGYRGKGRRDSDWRELVLPSEIASERLEVSTRIARLRRSRIREVIESVGFPAADALDLWSTLITRQEAIRRSLG